MTDTELEAIRERCEEYSTRYGNDFLATFKVGEILALLDHIKEREREYRVGVNAGAHSIKQLKSRAEELEKTFVERCVQCGHWERIAVRAETERAAEWKARAEEMESLLNGWIHTAKALERALREEIEGESECQYCSKLDGRICPVPEAHEQLPTDRCKFWQFNEARFAKGGDEA